MLKATCSTVNFFDQRREWSRWKHDINERYVPKFTGHLHKISPTIYYVDAFAGAGRFKGDPPVDGSPLIAARISQKMATELSRPYDLRCINVEPDVECFAELCETLSEFSEPRVTNLFGKFRDNLDEVLQLVGSYPTLFFLDPFGYKGMEWDVIQRLADRSKRHKTELILRLDVPKIARDAGWLDSVYRPAQAFVQSLVEMFGSDTWQGIAQSGLPQPERFRQFKDLYVTNVRIAFGYAEAYAVRSRDEQLKYYIVHATAHPMGRREMSDVIFRVDHHYEESKEQYKRAKQEASLQTSFWEAIDPPPPDPESKVEEVIGHLTEDICALGRTKHKITLGQLQDILVGKWFGKATESYYRRACGRLIDRGNIIRDRKSGIDEHTVLVFRPNPSGIR